MSSLTRFVPFTFLLILYLLPFPISISPHQILLPINTQINVNTQFSRAIYSTRKLSFSHNVTLTATLAAGSPPEKITMVLDTGSELSYLHCTKSPSFKATFSPNSSKSHVAIPCSSPTCRSRTRDLINPVTCDSNNLCHVILSYSDASSVEGTLSSDTFRLGTSVFPRTIFGCMDSGSGNSLEDTKTTGLLGMNRGSLSFVSQMGFRKFSYCISGLDSTGVLLFGDSNFTWLNPLNYTPLVLVNTRLPYFNRVAYTLHLEGIKVSNKQLRISKQVLQPDHTGAGQTIVDSGTQFTFLLGPAYAALKEEFLRQTAGILVPLREPNFVFEGAMDLCFRVSGGVIPVLPLVTVVFRGAEMVVSGERLLYRVPGEFRGSDTVHCFTFGNSDLLGMELYVVGHHHQQNVWMEYDIGKSRVGFASARCDLASQRLGLTD